MADKGLTGAEKGIASSTSGGIFSALLGGAAGYFLAEGTPDPKKPWYETEKGIAIAGGIVALGLLLVLAYRKRNG